MRLQRVFSSSLLLLVLVPLTVALPGYSNNSIQDDTDLPHNTTDTVSRRSSMRSMMSVLLPLVFSYKVTALTSVFLTALKIFIVQSILVAKTGLLGAVLLLTKPYLQSIKARRVVHAEGWGTYPAHSLFPRPEDTSYSSLEVHSHKEEVPSTGHILSKTDVGQPISSNRRSDYVQSKPKPFVVGYNTIIKKTVENDD